MRARTTDKSDEKPGLDPLIAILWRKRLLILAISVVFGLAFAGLAFERTPTFRATAILAPADTQRRGISGLTSALGSVGGLAAVAGIGLSGSDYAIEETMAVIKSQLFTTEFIQENNLMPELFPQSWDVRAGRWKGSTGIPTLGRAFHAFDRIRKVERDSKSGLIVLRIEWKDPVKAADWTNQLVERLNNEMRSRAINQSAASLGYLQNELAVTVDVTTREAISRLMEGQIKQKMLAHVTKEYALQVVDKAIPADADDPVRPVKILYIAFGLTFGAMAGIVIALCLAKRELSREK
jgi:uncharacterized protein involved in exopolysaccharide biosynthesis